MAQFTSLPIDLILALLPHLTKRDLKHLSSVNRRLRNDLERLLLATVSIRNEPPLYHDLLHTLIIHPHKRAYITHLRASHATYNRRPATPSDLPFLTTIATTLNFPHTHPIFSASTDADITAAYLLLTLYHLPSLASLDFGNHPTTAHSLLSYIPTAPACAPLQRALKHARLGDLDPVGWGEGSEPDLGVHIGTAIPWLQHLEGLELLRLEIMCDAVRDREPESWDDYVECYLQPVIVEPGTRSAVRHMVWENVEVSAAAFSQLLAIPLALSSFVWEIGACANDAVDGMDIRELRTGLQQQRESLTTLAVYSSYFDFSGADDRRDPDFDDVETVDDIREEWKRGAWLRGSLNDTLRLEDFPQLRNLALSWYVLKGLTPWRSAVHDSLPEILPPSIESLAVDMWYFKSARVQEPDEVDIDDVQLEICELVDEARPRFPKLRRIAISGTEPDRWDWLVDACEKAGVQLVLRENRTQFSCGVGHPESEVPWKEDLEGAMEKEVDRWFVSDAEL